MYWCLLLALLALVSALDYAIYASDLSTARHVPVGVLHYDSAANHSAFAAAPLFSLGKGHWCLHATNYAGETCFWYQEIADAADFGGVFALFVDAEKAVQQLTFYRGEQPGFDAAVRAVAVAPTPNLAAVREKKPEPEKIVRKKIVENENGEKVEITEEEIVEPDTRSWIQRNWMYIVPPLIIFLILSPEDKK